MSATSLFVNAFLAFGRKPSARAAPTLQTLQYKAPGILGAHARDMERLPAQYNSQRPSLGGVLTSTGFSRCFTPCGPRDVSPIDGGRLSEVIGICSSPDQGAHDAVVKGNALRVGNRAFLLINPPPICEIRSGLPQPRNLREGCRVLAPREPLVLVRRSALAGLVHPAEAMP